MLVLVMMPMGLSGLATTELAVTDRRVIGRVRKQRVTVPFKDIESVSIRRSLPGILFNYGSLTIIGNGIRVKFPGITKPKEIKAVIDTAVEKELFGDIAEGDAAPPKTPLRNPTAKTAKTAAKLPSESRPAPLPAKPREEPAYTKPSQPVAPHYKDPNTW